LIFDIAKRLGITEALGNSRQGTRALWQVIAGVIDQGSRLSAARLAGSHAACDISGLGPFNEDDLYENLAEHPLASENEINLTVAEGIHELTTLCATEMLVNDEPRCNKIPQPRSSVKQLFKAASVRLPDVLPCKGTRTATRKKLPENRATP
jgi:hypothetical protein